MLASLKIHLRKHWLPWVAGLLIAGYLCLSAGAFRFVKHHRGIASVEYRDLAFPWRWPQYRIKRGEHAIGQALRLLQLGRDDDAFRQLRVGLIQAPANRDGRLLLAWSFAARRRTDLARTTLMDGLDFHADDPEYIGPLLQFLLDQEADQLVVSLSERLLQQHSAPGPLTRIAGLSAATACYHRGNYDRAENFLTTWALTTTREGGLLGARIEWERGYHELALLLLRNLSRDFPQDEQIYVQLGDYLRAEGHFAEARRLAVLHQVAYPGRPRSATDQLHALAREGRSDDLERASERMLQDFSQDPAGLLALGDFAATNGRVGLARQILGHFRQNQFQGVTTIRLMEIESLLVAGRYAEALGQVQELSRQPLLEKRYVNVCSGLQAIAHYGLGDPVAGYASLTTLIAQPDLRTDSLLAMANRLIAMDCRAPAGEILTRAVSLNPQNQPALTRLVELDIETGNIAALTDHLRPLLRMRKPSRTVLLQAQTLLRSDAYLFLPGRAGLLDALARAIAPGDAQTSM